jgi:cytochrome bd ubiquinol oxidase subunit II
MPVELLVAALGIVALVAYAVLGGADFGGGIWDLFATGPRRDAQRDAIAHAMGPVWEANHVWLIFVIVIIFSAFPAAYAALSIALFVPFHLVLLGIILRGAHSCSAPTRRRARARRARARRPALGRRLRRGQRDDARAAGHVPGRRVVGRHPVWTVASFPSPAPFRPGSRRSPAHGRCSPSRCAPTSPPSSSPTRRTGELREDFRTRALLAGTAVVALSAIALPLVRERGAAPVGRAWSAGRPRRSSSPASSRHCCPAGGCASGATAWRGSARSCRSRVCSPAGPSRRARTSSTRD